MSVIRTIGGIALIIIFASVVYLNVIVCAANFRAYP